MNFFYFILYLLFCIFAASLMGDFIIYKDSYILTRPIMGVLTLLILVVIPFIYKRKQNEE